MIYIDHHSRTSDDHRAYAGSCQILRRVRAH